MHLPPIFYNGIEIDLAHLAPIDRKVTLELPPNIKKNVSVKFVFTCHCYSRRLQKEEQAPLGQFIQEGGFNEPRCEVPCDHIPARSWPLFRAREVLHGVIESIQREQTT